MRPSAGCLHPANGWASTRLTDSALLCGLIKSLAKYRGRTMPIECVLARPSRNGGTTTTATCQRRSSLVTAIHFKAAIVRNATWPWRCHAAPLPGGEHPAYAYWNGTSCVLQVGASGVKWRRWPSMCVEVSTLAIRPQSGVWRHRPRGSRTGGPPALASQWHPQKRDHMTAPPRRITKGHAA